MKRVLAWIVVIVVNILFIARTIYLVRFPTKSVLHTTMPNASNIELMILYSCLLLIVPVLTLGGMYAWRLVDKLDTSYLVERNDKVIAGVYRCGACNAISFRPMTCNRGHRRRRMQFTEITLSGSLSPN